MMRNFDFMNFVAKANKNDVDLWNFHVTNFMFLKKKLWFQEKSCDFQKKILTPGYVRKSISQLYKMIKFWFG